MIDVRRDGDDGGGWHDVVKGIKNGNGLHGASHPQETICLLLALKLEYPPSIHLIRGACQPIENVLIEYID